MYSFQQSPLAPSAPPTPQQPRLRRSKRQRLSRLFTWKPRKVLRRAYLIFFLCRDPRTPWYAKCIALLCLGYLFSPVQIIPDWIPVLGWTDDIVVIAFGLWLLVKLSPSTVMRACYRQALQLSVAEIKNQKVARIGFLLLLAGWISLTVGLAVLAWHLWLR